MPPVNPIRPAVETGPLGIPGMPNVGLSGADYTPRPGRGNAGTLFTAEGFAIVAPGFFNGYNGMRPPAYGGYRPPPVRDWSNYGRVPYPDWVLTGVYPAPVPSVSPGSVGSVSSGTFYVNGGYVDPPRGLFGPGYDIQPRPPLPGMGSGSASGGGTAPGGNASPLHFP